FVLEGQDLSIPGGLLGVEFPLFLHGLLDDGTEALFLGRQWRRFGGDGHRAGTWFGRGGGAWCRLRVRMGFGRLGRGGGRVRPGGGGEGRPEQCQRADHGRQGTGRGRRRWRRVGDRMRLGGGRRLRLRLGRGRRVGGGSIEQARLRELVL